MKDEEGFCLTRCKRTTRRSYRITTPFSIHFVVLLISCMHIVATRFFCSEV